MRRTLERMSATAIVFPGQGSHTPDMRDSTLAARPDLLEAVVEVVGEDPFPRAGEGTDFAQPAIFCASLAGWEAMDRPEGDFMAGHSLGELAALVAAGALGERAGLELVALRGRLMQEAGRREGDGGMVLSGPRAALPAAADHAKELGLRGMPLDVTGAFHSPMMAPALPAFQEALDRTEFRTPRVMVISAVSAQPFSDPRRELAEALIRPVRWRETMLALRELGAERFVEVGPGRVLTGLAKRTLSGVELISA
jgi:[acyl-carrier-protein] S-malonyltransferase